MDSTYAALWQREMKAISTRLLNLLHSTLGADVIDGEIALPEALALPDWATRHDRGLVETFTGGWLPWVGKLIADKVVRPRRSRILRKTDDTRMIRDLRDMEKAAKFVAEDIIAMRSLSSQERFELVSLFDYIRLAVEPAGMVRQRLANLLAFHVRFANDLAYGDDWESVGKRQEKAAKRAFPKAKKEDRELLFALLAWRALIHERFVNPRLEKIASTGASTGDQLLESFSHILDEVEGTAPSEDSS